MIHVRSDVLKLDRKGIDILSYEIDIGKKIMPRNVLPLNRKGLIMMYLLKKKPF